MSKRWMAMWCCAGAAMGGAATAARAETLATLRADTVDAVEHALAGCGVIAADVGGVGVPVPPVASAERVYYRDDGTHKRLVGIFERDDDWGAGGPWGGWGGSWGSGRGFALASGDLLGTLTGNVNDDLSFTTQWAGTVALLNAYETVGPHGGEVRDYNGQCAGNLVSALLAQGLVAAFERCVDGHFVVPVAGVLCRS